MMACDIGYLSRRGAECLEFLVCEDERSDPRQAGGVDEDLRAPRSHVLEAGRAAPFEEEGVEDRRHHVAAVEIRQPVADDVPGVEPLDEPLRLEVEEEAFA